MNTASPHTDLAAEVHDLIMIGAARWQVDAELKRRARDANQPVPSKDAIDAAYAEAVERWLADADQAPDEIHAYHIALRKSLIARSVQINDYPTAARIAADLGKLQDQYAAKRAAADKRPQRDNRIAKLRSRRPELKAV